MPATEFCDLHTHTLCSDGLQTPTQVVEAALERGLAALAITDHDSLQGLDEARRRAAGTGLEIVPGVELSTAAGELEVHVLGYFFDETNAEFLAQLRRFRDVRRERVRAILGRLGELGMPLDEAEVFGCARGEAVGRPHVAEAMVARGYALHLDDAFRRFLGTHRPAWVPKPVLTPPDAVRLVASAGGVTSVAHPATIGDDRVLDELAAAGLHGIECIHPKHDAATEARYREIAARHGLLVTGGSDSHGRRPGGIPLGYGNVPASVVEELRAAATSARTG